MINLKNVGKGYGKQGGDIKWPIRNYTGSLPDGVNVGILAGRGAGKTTLINLLAGVDIPTEGKVQRKSTVSYPFGFKGHIAPRLTLRQNVRFATDLYGVDFNDTVAYISDFAEYSGSLDTKFADLSVPIRGALTTALFFSLDFSHMLFDEMRSFGEPRLRRKCIGAIRRGAAHQSVFIVTGNPENLSRYCQIGGVLKDGKLTMYNNVPEAIAAYGLLKPDIRLRMGVDQEMD